MNNKLQTLKGFRDFLPSEVYKRNWVKDIMVKTAERWGFEAIETPTLEPYSLFEGEVGEDEKMFYKFKDLGGREVMLRYDQTVPTCRFVANNQSNLVFPFKRYQIQSVFRAENTQKGRYREFTQFDLDIFGIKSPTADAEIMAENLETYFAIGFKKPIIIFNNRDLMKNLPYEAIVAIDKLKKIGENGVIEDMVKKGISKTKAKEYFDFVKNIKPDETIKIITNYLTSYGFNKNNFSFEPTLARSFSYSQGPIWEIVIEDYKVGSVGGGERYDGMMKRLTGLDIPATGIAFGFDRTVEAADQLGLIDNYQTKTDILVTIFSTELLENSIKIAKILRENNINTEIYPDPTTKLEKQLKYADKKQIPYVVIIGQDEVKNNYVTLKNLKTKEQRQVTMNEVCKLLRV